MPTFRYEFIDPTVNSSKFWEVEHPYKGDQAVFRTTWGRIGTAGQTEVSPYPSPDEARKKLASKIREKERKGYVLVTGDQAKAAEASEGPGRTAKGHKAGSALSLQLLKPWDKRTVPAHAVVEPKIDGIRALFVFAGGRFCCFSRNGNTLNNVSHIAAELGRAFNGYCLDGELIAKTWEGTMKAVRSDERSEGSDVYFAVFDCLTHEEIDTRTCHRTLMERREALRRLWPKGEVHFAGILAQTPVRTPADVKRMMGVYLEAGFEGAVIKDLDSFYKFRRTDDWTKVKVFETNDYKVVGIVEGKGKYTGMFGKFLVKGPKNRVSGVGSGITDEQRVDFWRLGNRLIGTTIEVKHQGVSPDGGLRFPIFVRRRPDK